MIITEIEFLLPIFITASLLLAVYFYSVAYGIIKGHLQRTIKMGPILRFPIISLTIGSLLIMFAYVFDIPSDIHLAIELVATIIILGSSLSLNTNFRNISKRPLLIQLYLDNDIKEYDLITLVVEGSIPISSIIEDFTYQAKLVGKVIFLLGPQFNPVKQYNTETIHVGTTTHSQFADEINQYSPSELHPKIAEVVGKYSKDNHVFLIGDFLDNLVESLGEDDFFKAWSEISSKIKQKHVHGIFIIHKDTHGPRLTRLVEQFSDISIELKEVESRHRLFTYMKVTNYKDDIRTNWFKV